MNPSDSPGLPAPRRLSLALDIRGWRCLVVGGGPIGERKALRLVACGGEVAVVAPVATATIEAEAVAGRITRLAVPYHTDLLSDARLVVAATDDPDLNLEIGRDAEAAGAIAVVVSSAVTTPALFPAVAEQQGITVAVHTHGRDPVAAARLRDLIASLLFDEPNSSDGTSAPTITLAQPSTSPPHRSKARAALVGAGPGAPDLITLRGMRALRHADTVIIDGLLSPSFLEECGIPCAAKRIIWLGGRTLEEHRQRIESAVQEAVVRGDFIVRLKTGDPLIFGRAGEETALFDRLGVPWEIVPGLSSATAAPGAADLCLTTRGQGRSFAIASARCIDGEENRNLPAADNLVVLMGVAVLEQVITRLLAEGWSPATPAAVIERATMTWERRVEGSLEALPGLAKAARIGAPAVLILGKSIRSLPHRPRILFTGLDPSRFLTLGSLLHWPALTLIRNEAGAEAFAAELEGQGLTPHDLLIFGSRQAVDALVTRLDEAGRDLRILGGSRLVASGDGIVERLLEHGLRADLDLDRPDARRQWEEWLSSCPNRRALAVEGTHTPGPLKRELAAAGWSLKILKLQRIVPHPGLGRPLPEHDAVFFVSPRGVRAWAKAYGAEGFRASCWCLGEDVLRAVRSVGQDGTIVTTETAPR